MFHKFRKVTLYVQQSLVWPLRFVFLIVFFFIVLDVYEIFITGTAEYSYSNDSVRGEDDFRYWLKLIEKIAIGLFFIVLAFNVKDKNYKKN